MQKTIPMKAENKNNTLFTVIACLFVASLLISNIAAQKLIPVGPFIFTGGVLLFPVTFIFGDILTEVWSYQKSRIIVWTGFAASLFMTAFLFLIVSLPPAPGWNFQSEFATALSLVPRIVGASLVAYLCGEFLNNYVLAKFKLHHKGQKMGLRFVLSTIVGQSADTLIFATIALYGVIPNNILLTTMWSGFIFKTCYEVIALPFSLPLTKWIKQKSGFDLLDTETNFNPFVFKTNNKN
ncbi:MAG: queuosine precursor transporter [Saprospiraceae bacterium]|nr:queuosine precursor transporter [Saprospiraceae bacterium]